MSLLGKRAFWTTLHTRHMRTMDLRRRSSSLETSESQQCTSEHVTNACLAVKVGFTATVPVSSVSRTRDMVRPVPVTKSQSFDHRNPKSVLTSRCFSYNCESNGKCGRSFDEPVQAPAYAYALIAVGIVLRRSCSAFPRSSLTYSDHWYFCQSVVLA
jgi:hypothetical protein